MEIPDLIVRDEPNDVSIQIRIQKIENGFLVRAGGLPVFYANIETTADAISKALLKTKWPW